ncbi:DUF6438 domain-containing protein [Dyella terrae]|nr:DUF6438 domain-containing protein [Dyella terrae]
MRTGKWIVLGTLAAPCGASASQTQTPDVPLDPISITLERSGCDGMCPSYSIAIHGDGTAIFTGKAFTDVRGEHHFRVSSAGLAALEDSIRSKNLWLTATSYGPPPIDGQATFLTLAMGTRQHRITHDEEQPDVPMAIRRFEQEVMAVVHADEWIALTPRIVEQLRVDGFAFQSREGTELLERAIASIRDSDEQAMLDLMALGVPLNAGMMDLARKHGRTRIVAALHERGISGDAGSTEEH